ncbi:TPA: hypothetical protein N2P55_003596 [Escherichia coli]|nr:hypothetical protein [Escherichia coli]HCL6287057.1 hypothetical protein [Escherichia coli]
MQTIEIEKRKPTYFERNNWLMVVLLVLMVNMSLYVGMFFYKDFFHGDNASSVAFPLVNRIVGLISVLPLIYAGFLNYMANTLTAKLFRIFLIAALICGTVYAVFF